MTAPYPQAVDRPAAAQPPEPTPVPSPPTGPARLRALRDLLERHGRTLWTLGLILPLLVPKFRHAAHMTDMGTDGGHYVDVARHLAEGDGFTTSLSVLHQGFTSFPHPTSIYPAWPMLMAALLQVFSLRVVTVFVPAVLYFAVLLLADQVGRRLWPARWPSPLAMLDGGHAFVLCFVAASEFFHFTSKPYTEGLSFVVALLFLLRAHRLLAAFDARAGAEIGLWLALLFYCRSHFVIFAFALLAAGAFELVLRVRRRDARPVEVIRGLGAAGLSAALGWLPMHLWLATFLEKPGLGAYFRFDSARSTSYLTEVLPPQHTALLAVLSDRLQGSLLAFDPRWKFSYYVSFGPLPYALPLALLAFAAAPREAQARLFGLLAEPRTRLFRMFVLVLALGGLASIHAVHKDFSYEWYFHSRHATICVFAFFLAATYALGTRRRVIAALAAVILLAGAGVGYARAYRKGGEGQWFDPAGAPVLQWLQSLPASEPTIVAIDALIIRRAIWDAPTDVRRRVGVHTLYLRTTLDDLRAMSTRLGVRYFIVQEGAARALLLKQTRGFKLVDKIAVPDGNPPRLLVFKGPKRAAH